MTFFLAGQLDTPVTSRVDASMRNAQIEALVIHLRNLVRFFWGERAPDERHALAADYYAPGQWERIRPERPSVFNRLPPAHMPLQFERRWTSPAERVWDVVTQAHGLVPIVTRFTETVDPNMLAPGYGNGMRVCAQMFSRGSADDVAA